ncbi:hypothetical protein K491DRAFT_783841 [Lophiostoma macrostomum CBS 122681]|uniref:Uncharacterized protein n=1 Tax=Lophiostoma macrostomum CBS 122681 TaxID=1314788 RepID=A0A6A6SP48_9PLEO|nr:hypothetical protein K491DRAFT_783841 [Lophiostoma macrostomum CBS 122681]
MDDHPPPPCQQNLIDQATGQSHNDGLTNMPGITHDNTSIGCENSQPQKKGSPSKSDEPTPAVVRQILPQQITNPGNPYQFLNTIETVCERSMVQVFEEGQRDTTTKNRRLYQMLQNDKFKNWVTSSTSSVITIRFTEPDLLDTYSIGSFAATFVKSLRGSHAAPVVQFFCPISDMPCPPGSWFVLKGLIRQLLQYPNTALVTLEQLTMETSDPKYLWNLFVRILLSLVPMRTVFIVIHALGSYEDQTEANSLLRSLYRLSLDSMPRVKILLTPYVPSETADIVPFDDFLDLDKDPGDGDALGAEDLAALFENTLGIELQ